MGKGDRLDDLRARLEAPLADLGLDLFDVVRTGKGRGTVVQVMVDRPGGVDLETVTEATRVVSPLLDEWPGIDSAYTLEVSSPGLVATADGDARSYRQLAAPRPIVAHWSTNPHRTSGSCGRSCRPAPFAARLRG